MFVYCLLGMEFFAERVKIDSEGLIKSSGEDLDSNFNTFIDSMTTVFIVLANDGWSTIFFNHYLA